MSDQKRPQKRHKKPFYPVYDCETQSTDRSNCTNIDQDSCSRNSTLESIPDCDDFEKNTQLQLIILFAISTSVSLLNLGAFLIVYDKDPEIEEIPNFAERQRASSAKFSQ